MQQLQYVIAIASSFQVNFYGTARILAGCQACHVSYQLKIFSLSLFATELERTYKPHYHYQNLSPLANGRGLNRQKYAILQTHWH